MLPFDARSKLEDFTPAAEIHHCEVYRKYYTPILGAFGRYFTFEVLHCNVVAIKCEIWCGECQHWLFKNGNVIGAFSKWISYHPSLYYPTINIYASFYSLFVIYKVFVMYDFSEMQIIISAIVKKRFFLMMILKSLCLNKIIKKKMFSAFVYVHKQAGKKTVQWVIN